MADKVYEIKITTPYDGSGAQAAQAAFTALTQQAAQVAAAAGQAAGQEQGAAQAAGNLAAAAGQAAEQTGRFVDTAGRLRESNGQFVATGNGAKEAGGHIAEASHEAEHLFSTLKAGFSIDFAHRIVEGVLEIPQAFREAISEGVRYNATMESLGIQLAGALRSADPSKYLNFSDARAAGEDALDKLRAKSNQLGVDFHSLAETFAINVPVLASAGIRTVEEQIEAITLLNQVAAAKGISGFQAQRDIIDLLNGQGQRTLLGKELENQGVSNESIKRAKEMGTLMDLLREKLGAYGEAGTAAADTFNAAQQRLRNEMEQLFGEVSRPVFDELKSAYTELSTELAKPGARDALKSLGDEAGTVVHVGASLVEWAVKHAAVLVPLAKTAAEVTLALSALKLAQTALAVGGAVSGWVAETLAVGAHTVAVAKDTEAETVNAAAKTRNAAASVEEAEASAVAAAARMSAGLGPTAASLGGAGGAGAAAAGAGGLAGGLTFGGATLAVGAGVVGFETGRGIRESYTHEQRDAQEEVDSGPAIQREFARVEAIRQQVAESHSLEEQERANKAVADEIAAVQERITAAKEKDTPASQANLPILNQQLHSLERIQEGFAGIVSTREHTLTTDEKITSELEKQKETAKELADALKGVAKETDSIQGHAEQDRFNAQSPEQQVADLQRQRADLAKKLGASPISTFNYEQSQREQSIDSYLFQANRPAVSDDQAKQNPEVQRQREEYLAMVRQLQEMQERQKQIQGGIDSKQAQTASSAQEQSARGASTVQDQQAELAISRAKLNDNEALARYLEYQLRLRHEIKSLEDSKAPQEAIAAARERLGVEYQFSEEKIRQRDAEKAAREAAHADHAGHAARHPDHRDDRQRAPIQGYHANVHDAGFAGVTSRRHESTAAHDLAKWKGDPEHDPAARLARMPNAMEAADRHRNAAGRSNPLAPLFAGNSLGSFFGSSTAAASLAPATNRLPSTDGLLPGLGAPLPGAGGDAGGGLAAAGQGAYQAGASALSAAKSALSGAKDGGGGGSQKLSALEQKFLTLESEFHQLETTVKNVESQNHNQS